MEIRTESDISGSVAKALREGRGDSQDVFWGRVGIKQSGGFAYESGRSPIPKYVRLTLFAIYVAGLELDATTAEGVAAMRRLATLQHINNAAERADKLQEAMRHIKQASKLLGGI